MFTTIEILGFEWCIWCGAVSDDSEYELIQALSGDWMIYCQQEKFSTSDGNGGFRRRPVKRQDIETIGYISD